MLLLVFAVYCPAHHRRHHHNSFWFSQLLPQLLHCRRPESTRSFQRRTADDRPQREFATSPTLFHAQDPASRHDIAALLIGERGDISADHTQLDILFARDAHLEYLAYTTVIISHTLSRVELRLHRPRARRSNDVVRTSSASSIRRAGLTSVQTLSAVRGCELRAANGKRVAD